MTAPATTGVGVGEAPGVGVGVGMGGGCEADVDEPLTPPQPIMRARSIGLKNRHTRLKILTPLHFVNKT